MEKIVSVWQKVCVILFLFLLISCSSEPVKEVFPRKISERDRALERYRLMRLEDKQHVKKYYRKTSPYYYRPKFDRQKKPIAVRNLEETGFKMRKSQYLDFYCIKYENKFSSTSECRENGEEIFHQCAENYNYNQQIENCFKQGLQI